MFDFQMALILCPLLPLVAAIITAVFGPRVGRDQSHWPTWIALAGSLFCALVLARHVHTNAHLTADAVGYEQIVPLWTWVEVPHAYDGSQLQVPNPLASQHELPFRVQVALRLDPLTAIMLVTVNLVGLLVAIYGRGYMHGDRGYWRFFSYIALFVFSMNMLVTASNFVQLFVFWEAVGVCSYLLIGFWYERPAAAAAGKKAFLVNRIGDFGFLLAIFLIWLSYGSLDLHDSTGPDGATYLGVLGQSRLHSQIFVGGGIGMAIGLLLLLAACGKSAQVPLHVWLADAMEGPTPVSALIHAATMVTAGVYMVARCTPLFGAAPTVQIVVACVGAVTALMAAIIALTQYDLKRIFAYSTLSQLGLMFLALGTGTWAGVTAALFHLFTHAFFKALLFLSAGSVMHAMGNVVDIRRFSGLRHRMPWTHAVCAIGCLALAGIVPFSGFWSKDALLSAVREQSLSMRAALEAETASPSDPTDHHGDQPGTGHVHVTAHLTGHSLGLLRNGATMYMGLYLSALVTSFLTALYTFRAFYWTFYGPEVIPPEAGHHAHESPSMMLIPMAILAALSIIAGWLGHSGHRFADFLQQTPSLATTSIRLSPAPGVFHFDVALISTLVGLAGIALASFLYLGSRSEAAWLRSVFSQVWCGYAYQLSRGKFFFDQIYAAMIVQPLRAIASGLYFLDRGLVDGLVDFIGSIPAALAAPIRHWQNGLAPRYGLLMIVGAIVLIGVRIWWGT